MLAIAYAAPAALFAVVLGSALGDQLDSRQLLMFLPASVLAVFLFLQVAVAHSWNRRAVRLRVRTDSAPARRVRR